MPYDSIASAKSAGFPCSAEDIDLTLAQINKLAEFYDAIKKAKSADNPMAAAWTQWKEAYKKEGDKWVLREEGEHETHARWIKVAKKDQKKVFKDGSEEILDEQALINSAESFKNKGIEINHKVPINDSQKITGAKYEAPFLYMQFDKTTEKMFRESDATGWSVRFDYPTMKFDGNRVVDAKGKNISILYYPHMPTCTPEMGCHETFEFDKGDLEGDKMEDESKIKSVVEDIKGMFEQLMAVIKPKNKEEVDPNEPGKERDMDKVEELTSELATKQGEFETMKADRANEVKALEEKVAAFEQEKVDAVKAKMDADWEQLKKEVIPPGLVSKKDDEEKLKAEFEQTPHTFVMRMASFEKHYEQHEEGAEFSTEHDESISAINELKKDTGRK